MSRCRLLLALASLGLAAGDAAAMGGGGPGAGMPVGYQVQWQPSAEVQDQPGELARQRKELRLAAPIWGGEERRLLLSGRARQDSFDGDAGFQQQPLPDSLWDLRLGATYLARLDNDRRLTLAVSVGSTSDRPFERSRDLNLSAMAFVRLPADTGNAWTLGVLYMPMSELAFPLPVVAYRWSPNDELELDLGVPLRVNYTPREGLRLSASYMPVRRLNARVSQRLSPRWQAFAGYEWDQQSWFLHDREDDRQRLFGYEQRISLGTEATLWGPWRLELAAGYHYDRHYFLGEGYADRAEDAFRLAPGLAFTARTGLRW